MAPLSQTQKIVAFLKQHSDQKFTAREIATAITKIYTTEYSEKRNNPRFKSDDDLIRQVTAEIGAHKSALLKICPDIHFQEKPRPQRYWYSDQTPDSPSSHDEADLLGEPDLNEFKGLTHTAQLISVSANDIDHSPLKSKSNLSEHDLYPLLINFLNTELNLYCLRINEKRSANSRGQHGNRWLHPDIVAMQPLDQQWDDLVRTCAKHASGQNVKLWSFEVKKQLNGSNLRSSFFQAVSNSSWANEGYLVASEITNMDMTELRMLSALHGIGFILLNVDNPADSEILLPARPKSEADWQSINRILGENADFRHFIDLVANYYQSGRVYPDNWNK